MKKRYEMWTSPKENFWHNFLNLKWKIQNNDNRKYILAYATILENILKYSQIISFKIFFSYIFFRAKTLQKVKFQKNITLLWELFKQQVVII